MGGTPWAAGRSLLGPTAGLLLAVVITGCHASSTPAATVATQDGSQNVTDGSRSPEPAASTTQRTQPTARARALLRQGPLRGVALGLFSQDPEYSYSELLAEIHGTGARWVSLCVNHYQEHHDSVGIDIPDARSAGLDRVRTTTREAHALGLRVMLFPILLLADPAPDQWRGTLAPRDTEAWYQNYGDFLERYARLAEEENVAMLSVGSEFNSMESDAARWRALIARVRALYSGALTYSVNWDSLDGPGFLDELDIVGMTTYYSLTEKDDPTVAELEAAWRPIREDILLWQAHLGIPLMFTEVGFSSQDGINKDPWNYYISKRVDLEEQVDCYQAFTNTWKDVPQLSAVFFYNWFGHGGAEDTGYTPRGKPALDVMRQWFPAQSRDEKR